MQRHCAGKICMGTDLRERVSPSLVQAVPTSPGTGEQVLSVPHTPPGYKPVTIIPLLHPLSQGGTALQQLCGPGAPETTALLAVPLPWSTLWHGLAVGTGRDTPAPQHPVPLLPLEGCLSARCPLQAEDTGTQDGNVTLAAGAGHGVGWEGTSPPRPASPAAGTPWPRDRAQRAQGEVDTVPEGRGRWGRRSKASPGATRAGSGGSRGAAPGGGRGRGPTRGPERRCYIYCTRARVSASRVVTQALQPARIRGDGTFLSKNNPPAVGERAGVEVTDWTAAHAAPLPGPLCPRRGPGPRGHRASPMPRWLQAEPPRGYPQGPRPPCTARPGDLSLKPRWHQLCQAQVGYGSPH